MKRQPRKAKSSLGFTLIELLVALAIVGLLVSLAVPRYFGSVDKSKETALKHNLHEVRQAIDQHLADTGRYPDSLDDLVQKKYLRTLPVDPITDSDSSWVIVPPGDKKRGAMYDIKSGASGTARDGSSYGNW